MWIGQEDFHKARVLLQYYCKVLRILYAFFILDSLFEMGQIWRMMKFISFLSHNFRSSMDSLYPLFFQNLEDNIPSVRQGAAVALGNVIRAYGK